LFDQEQPLWMTVHFFFGLSSRAASLFINAFSQGMEARACL
jgi:hypothetical protein